MQFRDVLTIAANAPPGRTLPGGWTPALITSATPRGFVDFEDNSKITTATGVSQIVDTISGSAFVQATGTAQPLLITSATTGRQVASFDGTDDELTFAGIPTNWPVGTTAGGIFLVCNQTDTAANNRVAVAYGGTSTNSNRSIFKLFTPSACRGHAGTGASSDPATNTTVVFNGRHCVLFDVGAAAIRIDIDAAMGTSVATVPNTLSTRARIGASTSTSAASFFQGEISAIVVWQGTLSDLEKQYLYLWGRTRLGFV